MPMPTSSSSSSRRTEVAVPRSLVLVLVPVLIQILLTFSPRSCLTEARRLETRDRWIVDRDTGARVKLSCVSWPSHMESMVSEGLSHEPLPRIGATVAGLGFNCVRLTWATFMVTRPENQNLTVLQSLQLRNLTDAIAGIRQNNPEFLGLGLLDSLRRVAAGLGSAGLLVELDNHISRPQWCCGNGDGNGFFGDADFDPDEWVRGLATVAAAVRGDASVVAMSLRNELRGSGQNPAAWRRYMTRGAEAVHAANPDVLVVVSGLSFDTDLSFLRDGPPLSLSFSGLAVYEFHWYAFTEGSAWAEQPANALCPRVTERVRSHAGFLLASAPVFMSEFGTEQKGTSFAGNRYLPCLLAYAAKEDLDWALWGLQGSYMRRNGQTDFDETYGVLDRDWSGVRSPAYLSRLAPLQQIFQDPFATAAPEQALFHPATGSCVAVENGKLRLGSCRSPGLFLFPRSAGVLGVSDGSGCVSADGAGKPAAVSGSCSGANAQWTNGSAGGQLQWSVTEQPGPNATLCLDGGSAPGPPYAYVLTTPCICRDGSCSVTVDPEQQWFQLVTVKRDR